MMRRDEDLADGKDWVGGTEKSVGVEEFEIVANDADLEEAWWAEAGGVAWSHADLTAVKASRSRTALHCTVAGIATMRCDESCTGAR